MRVPGLKRLRREAVRLGGRLFGGDLVLGYHRVADDPDDPHDLAVSPLAFEAQLRVVRRHFDPVPLGRLAGGETARRDGRGRSGRRRVAFTFDDGYADVLHAALPLLARYGIPVTVFVVSDAVGCERFEWDTLRGGREGRPLEFDELQALAAGDRVEIGAHTRSHPDLRTLPPQGVDEEIVEGRARLEEWLEVRVRSFAYPHGGISPEIREAVARAGFERGCASHPGLVRGGSDPLALPRLWPPDLAGAAFERWLAGRTGIRRARSAASLSTEAT